MITLDNISYEIGGRFLFRDCSLQIVAGDRIGLIGKNGAGKTTLINLILGEDRTTSGQISTFKGIKIGFLPQEHLSVGTDKTVLEEALEAFEEQYRLLGEIEDLLVLLETDQSEPVITRLTEKQMRLEALGGTSFEAKAHQILDGLGFDEKTRNQKMSSLSGGWRMRVMLGRILLGNPDFLLLDEPTNHLDLPSIEWLENYLNTFKGAFMVVSHDRYFLDRLVNKTVEISRGKFNSFKGNYSYYLKERVVRREVQKREYENQQKFILDAERFISRFRAKASKAKQAQSKVKMLERLERIEPPEEEESSAKFNFVPKTQPGKTILDLDLKRKAYDDKVVLLNSKLTIMRGEKIALVGANGKGKSTALRIIGGQESFEGNVKLGHNVEPAFFAQHQLESLGLKNTILEEMSEYINEKGEAFVRGVLGGFLFSGDDVKKKISVLSGGEKSRVALAKTLFLNANFLLLDEPTNHLDINSINILIDALKTYEGTVIVVSHDRYFLSNVANKVWYINEKELKEYPGNFTEFHQSKIGQEASKFEFIPKKEAVQNKEAPKTKSDYHSQKALKNKIRKLKSDVKKSEEKISKLEEQKKVGMESMLDPAMSTQFSKLAELQKEVDRNDKEIQKMTEIWEKALMELEEIGELD